MSLFNFYCCDLTNELGTLVGVYASYGGHGQRATISQAKGLDTEADFAYFSNWTYEGLGQKVDYDNIVPSY